MSWRAISCEYDFSDEKLQGYGWNQTPKTRGPKGHIFGSQKERNSKAGMALDKILFRIWYLCWNLTSFEDQGLEIIGRQREP